MIKIYLNVYVFLSRRYINKKRQKNLLLFMQSEYLVFEMKMST